MKNVNVLLAVVLCAGLCVLFGLFNRSADESLGWSPNDMYMQSILSSDGSSFTSANLSGGNVSNDGVAVSMRSGSFSLRTRTRHASSPNGLIANGVPEKSADFLGAFSPNSLIGHMTSSAEYHSFGGGSNMAMGSYTSSSNNLIASSPAIDSYRPSPSSPIALSPNSLITSSPSNGEVQVSAEQALMSASSSASGLFGGMMTSYGTASYDQVMYGSYGSNGSGKRGVKGKQNAAPGMEDSWLNWLDNYYSNTLNWWDEGKGNGSSATLDWQAAYNAYLAMLESWNYTMGDPPTWEEFEEWLWLSKSDGFAKNGHTYTYVPIGNILPLVLLALMYMIILFVKRNKIVQL